MNGIPDKSVEAARYAVLQRMAPAIRHAIVGKLHPIALVSDAMERRMHSDLPDLASVQASLGQIKRMSRTAMLSFTHLITWLAPEKNAVTPLGEGIDECLKLLSTEFGMRGFDLENHAREVSDGVSHSALRNVLSASLLAATDLASAPADLLVTAKVSSDQAVLSIFIRSADRVAVIATSNDCRRLSWSDVEVLADAESVKLSHHGKCITLHYPILSR